jgi:hypothetical protein
MEIFYGQTSRLITKMGAVKKNRDMNRQDLLEFLRNLEIGTRIPGAITGKTFKFGGLKTHSGRGHFPHMKGELVVVLISEARRRSEILLCLDPLLLFVNAKDEELEYGCLPNTYVREYCLEGAPEFPNRSQYESHYKAMARYIRQVTQTSDGS